MNRKKRFFLISTILTIVSTILFNHLYANDLLIDTAKNLIDTTAIKVSDIQQNPALFDFASILPFHDHYLIWDTTTVHPYHFDLTHMQDTVKLVLADHNDCAFIAPAAGFITSGFGVRVAPRYRYARTGKRGALKRYFTGYSSQYHYGVDLALHKGDNVYAAFDGIVRYSSFNTGGYGNCVVIRHYNGLETLYGHLNGRIVTPGQAVRAGELIGYGGSTGYSTGPHLHFETRYLGEPIDPTTFISFKDSTYRLKNDTLLVTRQSFNYTNRGYNAYAVKSGRYRNAGRYSTRGTTATASLAGAKYYVVRKGDTVSSVSNKSGLTVNRILQVNGIQRNTVLHPGQKLVLK